MNAIEQAKQEIQSALESIHKVESDLGWSDDSQAALASLVRATAALSSVDAQPVAWMRNNRKECITAESKHQMESTDFGCWKEVAASYTIPLAYASPLPQAAQPVSLTISDKEAWEIYSRAQQSAWEKKGVALAIAITQAIIAEVRALAAHPVAQPASVRADFAHTDATSTVPQAAQPALCRQDGRCQYAINHGAEGLGHCPEGRCCMAQPEQAAPGVPEGWQAVFLPDGWSDVIDSMVRWARKTAPEVEMERIDLFYREICARPLSPAPALSAVDAQKVRNDAIEMVQPTDKHETRNLRATMYGIANELEYPNPNLAQLAERLRKEASKAQPASAGKDAEDARRWISITDRLPEPNQVVCLVDENRWRNTGGDFDVNVHACGYLASVGHQMYWSCFSEPRGLTLDAFTHWTPVPAISAIAQKESWK